MKKNDVLVILIPSLLIVVLWVIFNVYHNFVTSTIPGTLNLSIQPIGSDFDEKSINSIKERERIAPTYELGGQALAEDLTTLDTPLESSPSAIADPDGSLSP